MSMTRRRSGAVAFAPLLTAAVALGGCRAGGGAAGAAPDAAGPKGVDALGGATAREAGGAGGAGGHVDAYPAGDAWARWPMPNARLPGLPHAQSYDTPTSEVVVDRVTGLMWQRRLV